MQSWRVRLGAATSAWDVVLVLFLSAAAVVEIVSGSPSSGGARCATQLVVLAYESGLVRVGHDT